MEFRYDINALRALAVFGVILFHFAVPGVSGGYAGVDVFFVISGFLMTKIIFDSVEKKTFSYPSFLLARARRIIPALAFLVFVLLALGYWFLSPRHYEWLGRDAASAIGFVSNQLFAKKVDYFSPSGEPSWLLHTWSLSVEWQFYLLFPLVVMACARWLDARISRYVFAAAFVGSFALNLTWSFTDQTAAFYGLSSRVWIFLTGALVYFYPARRSYPKIAFAGLALITFSYLFLGSKTVYPGIAVLLPAVGAACFIWAQPDFEWMRTPLVNGMGRISYSLYLWHWPVVVFAEYLGWLQPHFVPALMLGVFVLSLFSFFVIEEKARSVRTFSSRRYAAVVAFAVAFLYVGACVIEQKEGFPDRVPSALKGAQSAMQSTFPRQAECLENPDGCKVGKGIVQVALWGDSHADAIAPAYARAVEEAGTAGVIYAVSACPPVQGWIPHPPGRPFKGWSLEGCRDFTARTIERVSADRQIKAVFMVGNWQAYAKDEFTVYNANPLKKIKADEKRSALVRALSDTACVLARSGKKVYLLAPVPVMPFNQPLHDLRRGFLGVSADMASLPVESYRDGEQGFSAALKRAHKVCGAEGIDVEEVFCPDGKCLAKRAGVYLYRDQDHLAVAGAYLLLDRLKSALRANVSDR